MDSKVAHYALMLMNTILYLVSFVSSVRETLMALTAPFVGTVGVEMK
jgi:hypothetical protein